MSRGRFQPEEIIGKVGNADVLLGRGEMVAEVVKGFGMCPHQGIQRPDGDAA